MSTEGQRQTARIYQFPVRGGTAAERARSVERSPAGGAPTYCDAAHGSGWYHDAAIQEAARTTKS
ncbi:MAG: DUF2735 domain-containing protein [Methylobacterium frigidaeris]